MSDILRSFLGRLLSLARKYDLHHIYYVQSMDLRKKHNLIRHLDWISVKRVVHPVTKVPSRGAGTSLEVPLPDAVPRCPVRGASELGFELLPS